MTRFLDALGTVDRHYDDGFGINRLCTTHRLLERSHSGGTILEVGAWPGDFAICLKRLGYDVVGVDVDPSRASATFAREGVVVHKANIEEDRLPFADGSIPYVVFTEVIEHLYANPLHALAELRRVLAPGGRMLISTPNLARWENRVLFSLGRPLILVEQPYEAFRKRQTVGHMGHLRLFTPDELRDLLRRTGFRAVEEHFTDLEGPSPLVCRTAASPGATSAPGNVLQRLMRRRSLQDVIEAIGTRLSPLAKRLSPEMRGHCFLVVEKAAH